MDIHSCTGMKPEATDDLVSASQSLSKVMRKRYEKGGKTYQKVKGYWHGLDAAGKTTTLYRLKLGEVVTTILTIDLQPASAKEGHGLYEGLDWLAAKLASKEAGKYVTQSVVEAKDDVVTITKSNPIKSVVRYFKSWWGNVGQATAT
uniref:Uncharacterized protein n=1 Tax=Branchiostoma floridae TaxID=7739 RepID=C3Y6M2_BRAFL|eukprot:XP_002607972.1 hypothetical protein BRAFLDRAFT_74921 [Branchiostoma floridae]